VRLDSENGARAVEAAGTSGESTLRHTKEPRWVPRVPPTSSVPADSEDLQAATPSVSQGAALEAAAEPTEHPNAKNTSIAALDEAAAGPHTTEGEGAQVAVTVSQ
jgi:hypothetical protein